MTLSRDSKLVRFAYFFRGDIPRQTSLCAFFWRTFVFIPLAWLFLISLVVVIIVLAGIVTYRSKGAVIPAVAAVIAFFWMLAGGLRGTKLEDKFNSVIGTIADSTFWQGLKAVKGTVCPILEITGPPREVVDYNAYEGQLTYAEWKRQQDEDFII